MIKIREVALSQMWKKRNYSPQRRDMSNWHIRPTLCYLDLENISGCTPEINCNMKY